MVFGIRFCFPFSFLVQVCHAGLTLFEKIKKFIRLVAYVQKDNLVADGVVPVFKTDPRVIYSLMNVCIWIG